MENQSPIMYDKCSSSNKVTRTSSSSLIAVSDSNHGRSKAQLCLQKIIAIILYEKENKFEKKKGLGIDLNLSSNCINNGESNVGFTSGSILVENCEGECDLEGVDVIEVEERRELSEVIDLKTPEIEEKGDVEMVVETREMMKNVEKGNMDLLVEAARLISGDFKEEIVEEDNTKNQDEEVVRRRRKSKRISNNSRMFDVYEDFEDISPIVKSKRGRNQVLPLKYRDSVLLV